MMLRVYLHLSLVCATVLPQSAESGKGEPSDDLGAAIRVLYQTNRRVNLTCSFPASTDVTVTWRKTGLQVPIAVGRWVISHPDKYQIAEDKTQGISSLIIDAATVTDAGFYACSWMLNRTVANSTTFVLARKDKHFTLIETSDKPIKASIGDDVELPCIVQRRHKYKVLWLDPRNRIVTFGSRSLRKRYTISSKGHRRNWTLKITNVNKNDFGTLTCLVSTNPILSSTVVLSRKGDAVPRLHSAVTAATTQRHGNHPNVTSVSDSSAVNVDYDPPNIAAVHQAKTEQSWDRLILGTSIGVCGFVLFVGLASGCFLVDRIQKMTRRIIQQELTLDNMRMRRRSRRLTSETHVIIGRQNNASKDNANDSYMSGNAQNVDNWNIPKPTKQQRLNGTYCEPWSSSSDIIQAMNAAYADRQGREPENRADEDPAEEAAGSHRQEPPGGDNPCPDGRDDHVMDMEGRSLIRVDGEGECNKEDESRDM